MDKVVEYYATLIDHIISFHYSLNTVYHEL